MCLMIMPVMAFAGSKNPPKKALRHIYVVKVDRWIDADTFKGQIETQPGVIAYVSIRDFGDDTPESKGTGCGKMYGGKNNVPDAVKSRENALGRAATAFVKQLIPEGTTVKISDVFNGKFAGRWIARIMLMDGRLLSEILIEKGYAVAYFGGAKTAHWCKS